MSLYSLILLLSFSVPFFFSFDKKVAFFKIWKFLIPASVISGSIYLAADILFAKNGIWGFNPSYHSGIVFGGLPLEEWLFFIVIPYSCIFIHYVIRAYFPSLKISEKSVKYISLTLLILSSFLIFIYRGRIYTQFNFALLIIVLLLVYFSNRSLLQTYFISFPVMLLPFFIVDGILTGAFFNKVLVWYSQSEISGFKIVTIPVEDAGYAFSLVLLNMFILNIINKLYGTGKK